MNKIAAVVGDLGPSQSNFYMIKEFNKACSLKELSLSTFYARPAATIIRPYFSCRNISFLSGYHGVAIATTLTTADTLLKSCNNSQKYLYLWDLEWLNNMVNFEAACKIMLDNRLSIIARSESHAQVIDNFCNKSVCGIVDNWNISQLMETLHAEL